MFQAGHRPANFGQVTTTDPLAPDEIARVKAYLADRPRDLAMFCLGINSAFRSGDLVSLERSDLTHRPDGRTDIVTREQKTGKLRRVTLNQPTSAILRRHLDATPGQTYLFEGERGRFSTSYLARMLKDWCREAGVEGKRVAGHTLRKTFVRTQHDCFGTSLTTLMFALGHSSERQTLGYMGKLSGDVDRAYANAI